jgi:hypothetical protein
MANNKKRTFYTEFQETTEKATKTDHIILSVDFSARTGNQPGETVLAHQD